MSKNSSKSYFEVSRSKTSKDKTFTESLICEKGNENCRLEIVKLIL